jgi:hypothetical protein
LGLIFGAMIDNMVMGVGSGLVIGVVIGVAVPRIQRADVNHIPE